MPAATLVEAIAQLRAEGKTDHEIAVIFNRSKIALPPGNYLRHSIVSVREAMGEETGGIPMGQR